MTHNSRLSGPHFYPRASPAHPVPPYLLILPIYSPKPSPVLLSIFPQSSKGDLLVTSPEFPKSQPSTACDLVPREPKMADDMEMRGLESREHDNDGGDELIPRRNEWEVVSLTASTYAASPGPKAPEPEEKDSAADEKEAEASQALFLSGHFVFSPTQHESFSIGGKDREIRKEVEGEGMASDMKTEEGDVSQKKEVDNLPIPGLDVPEDFRDVQVFNGKGDSLTIHDTDFDEMMLLCKGGVMEEEQVIYGSGNYGSIGSETTLGGLGSLHEFNELSESALDPLVPQSQNSGKGDKNNDKHDENEPAFGAWWKKPVTRLFARAKETNAFWSIFIAAAVMGLVILGHKWQQERRQEKWQLSLTGEKPGKAVIPLSRFKDIVVLGSRRSSYISNGVAASH